MKKFPKLKDLRLGNYIRELSIVIIGVAVTLYANNLISSKKEKNDLKQQLNLIYTELEDNIVKLDELIEFYNKHEKLSGFLQENFENPNEAVLDSIRKYGYIIGMLHPFTYKKGAYDMFLSSGTVKLLNNKQFFLDITECYAMLEITKKDYNQYEDLKLHEIQKHYDTDLKLYKGIDITDPKYSNLFIFYTAVSKGGGGFPSKTKEQIEKVLFERNNKKIK